MLRSSVVTAMQSCGAQAQRGLALVSTLSEGHKEDLLCVRRTVGGALRVRLALCKPETS